MSSVRSVKAKKKCCKSTPRCKSCPVVLKRLADAGFATRESKKRYLFGAKVPKKALTRARAV
ncbi:hypothetical protein [Phytoactinopolyspora endophytica]|uniref:hypothetical protein n=1 Tax=Phytoactinopolyspora endophytica TaxID=1642495 RepID=UPI00101C9D42|nr:hypothetical protein [Phytoactinopolyspora endophytica]